MHKETLYCSPAWDWEGFLGVKDDMEPLRVSKTPPPNNQKVSKLTHDASTLLGILLLPACPKDPNCSVLLYSCSDLMLVCSSSPNVAALPNPSVTTPVNSLPTHLLRSEARFSHYEVKTIPPLVASTCTLHSTKPQNQPDTKRSLKTKHHTTL